jgi:hypothetical protein
MSAQRLLGVAATDSSESSIGLILLPIVLYLIGAVVFFRWQILSTFDLISGSDETLLVAFIHEHVYRSFSIHSGLLSPPFLFNQPNTLGYSDAFF